MRVMILTLGIVGLSACATSSAWIVKREGDSGVIGYSGDARAKVKTLAKAHCNGRHITMVSDDLRMRDRQVSSLEYRTTTANTSGTVSGAGAPIGYDETTTKSGYVPVTETQRESWREMTYKCD